MRGAVKTSIRLLLGCVILCGCKGGASYTVLQESRAPNGELTAQLVKRHARLNLANDEYYVVIAKETFDRNKLEEEAFDTPVLVANHASGVKVRWDKPHEISLVCDRCGLEADDVLKRVDQWRDIKVSYVGFPTEDADE